MIFFYLVTSTLYLFFQKYLHNNIALDKINYFEPTNIVYLILLIFFLYKFFISLFNKNEENFLVGIISPLIFFLAFLSEIMYQINIDFLKSYFLGYPAKKIILSSLFSIILIGLLISFSIYFVKIIKKQFDLIRSFQITGIVILAFFLYLFIVVNLAIENKIDLSGKIKYDFAVVLGAAVNSEGKPLKILRKRLEKGKEIFGKGLAEKLFLTGSNAPGEISEAKAGRNYLIEKGINENKILFEEETTSTFEQIKYLKENFPNNKLIVVSDKFHLNRINEMADYFDLKIDLAETSTQFTFKQNIYFKFREAASLLLFNFFGV